MKVRLLIASVFIMIGIIMIIKAITPWEGNSREDLLLNLGTEIVGIAITVAIVDLLMQRQRLMEEAKKISWRALHEVDYAVWVWQGGIRRFDIGELIGLISTIREDDPLPQFTQNLLLRIGSSAENTIRVNADVLKTSKKLKAGLSQLGRLSSIRDIDSLLQVTAIGDILMKSTANLANVVGLEPILPPRDYLHKFKNSSVEHQEWRHFGSDHPPKSQVEAG